MIESKKWSLEYLHVSSDIWQGVLVFDSMWPRYELVPYTVKMNMLAKFQDWKKRGRKNVKNTAPQMAKL